MTDKQIMIDVRKCKEHGLRNCEGKLIHWCHTYDDHCADFNDCYYKQLKRKEKSEEKLVKQIQTICDFINNRPETFKGINGSVDKIITDYAKAKEQECEEFRKANDGILTALNILAKNNIKLRATLTEIKEIAEKQCVCGVDCIDMKQILQKIDEVEE